MSFARRVEIAILVFVTAGSVALAWAMPRPPASGLLGRYWSNTEWAGAPTLERMGVVPSDADYVRRLRGASKRGSAEWTGLFLAETTGVYEFATESDEGSSLYIGDTLVADNGGVHPVQLRAGSVELTAGWHPFRLYYFRSGGGLLLKVYVTKPGGVRHRIAASSLLVSEAAARSAGALPMWRWVAVAVPVIWACLFLYVPVRLALWWMWTAMARVTPKARDRRVAALLLGLGIVLMAWGLGWGLVGDDRSSDSEGWAADELPASFVRDLIDANLANGWYDKYPMMHYLVLALPVSAFALADNLMVLSIDSIASHAAQLAMMRVVSVVMGLGVIGALFVAGAELGGPRHGALSALALLFTPLFAYYGKVANLDIPALCWFGWAIVAFLRILRSQKMGDYVLLGVMAAAAVATKDQAYANLTLLPPAVIWVTARSQPHSRWWQRLAAAAVDRRVLAAAVVSVIASAILHNMVFNFAGFQSHMQFLSSIGVDIAEVPRTLGGYIELTTLTARLYPFAFGWPLFGLAVIGLVQAAMRPERRWWFWLLLVPLSFHLTFTWVTLYVNDRYLMGGMFVLALFIGSAAVDLLSATRLRPARVVGVVAAFAYAGLYAASINVMMVSDARNVARDWIQVHAPAGARVALVGYYLPVLPPTLELFDLRASPAAVREAAPDFIMVNDRYAQRYRTDRSPEGRDLMAALADGSIGYDEVFRYRTPPPAWARLFAHQEFRRREESRWTNLDKVNPEMVVYRRR